MISVAEKPAHVPVKLVYDFDCFDPPGGSDDIHLAWKRLQADAPPIFWTPRNGGHWIATRANDIEVIQTDSARFSNHYFALPKLDLPVPFIPLSLDPPDHTPIRMLIAPAFAPKAVQQMTKIARTVAIELIEQFAPRGSCEFVGEFAKVLPVVVFLNMVGLPQKDREFLLPLADVILRTTNKVEKASAYQKVVDYLGDWVDRRTAEPGDDLISKITQSTVQGRPITRVEKLGLCLNLMLGGLDTVASMLGFIAFYLAEHPHLQKRLLEEPEIHTLAIEELMRRHGVPNTARVVARDLKYNDIAFMAGEMVLVSRALYNLDEYIIERPLEVDLDRPAPIPNSTFGSGIHKCPGAILARQEIRIFMEEWLKRIPLFTLQSGFKKQTISGGVNRVLSLELVWNNI